MRPNVGFGIMVLRGNKVLLGKRHDDPVKADSDLHGEGTWTCVGGKLDYHENLIDGVKRELKEETGLTLKDAEVVSVTDDIVSDNHYVTVGFLVKHFKGEPEVREPDEITEWRWVELDKLPENLFPPSKKMIENYLNKTLYETS
jgi:8-oxo-dGTP diphosphatase